jgi:hypothetical protein
MVILSNVILDSSYWLNVTGKTFMSGTLVCGSFPTMEYFGTLDLAWRILSQNIRGINAVKKWNYLRNKINEIACDIVCIQEKRRPIK